MPDKTESEITSFLSAHGPFEDPPLFSNGDSMGEWMIRAFLGRGGSAEVYRAENMTTGLIAALKILCKSDDRTRERFKRETRLLAEIQSSTFPKFYGAGCADGRFYIAEELLGPMQTPKADAEVARFVLAVAAGVEELHRRGFVHRDIKPQNVMIRPATGESVLIDMGLAKEDDEVPLPSNDRVSVVNGRAVGVGTPGFSAPEQFTGGKIGPATDIHALGMLANVCFDGKPPKAWTKIIRRSTSSIPEQRYATISEFAKAIHHRHATNWWLIGIISSFTIATVMAYVAMFCKISDGDNPQKDSEEATKNIDKEQKIVKKELVNAILDVVYQGEGDGGAPVEKAITNGTINAESLFCLGETKYDHNVMVTRIALNGRDVSIPKEVRLDGKQRIMISGPGRLTASITGTRDVSLDLGEQATLINLTSIPYPESSMKYVLCGACYLNFKNLDWPADGDIKNIWVADSISLGDKGMPSFRFRGPDSYEEARKIDQETDMEAMRKGILPSY
ncbi:MAG: serine/threonine protein kinase [Kiritimatiellae bacterium]|nr:serine/threonine protein kinase [Kiritimatiellia bacterium]